MKLGETLSSEVPSAREKILRVQAGAAAYDVVVGAGLLGRIGDYAQQLFRETRCAVVADENTARFFGGDILEALRSSGFAPTLLTVGAGETSKSLEEIGRLCDEMANAGLDRTSFLIALGGGVIGDLAGFAAAIYHRGIRFVQVPTTLLAQVDSAIGGKTGVNTRVGKNLLGAVHQPALVLADVETLRTLPLREFRQGFAEIIKHAIIADATMFQTLDALDASKLPELIARNIEIKAAVVAADERDVSGARALLNFGHTVGHAIERVAGYGTYLHGEAISLGIVAACEVSVRKAGLAEGERETVVKALQAFELPTTLPPEFRRDEIVAALQKDKKFEAGKVRFVVTSRLGSARLTSDVTLEDISHALATL